MQTEVERKKFTLQSFIVSRIDFGEGRYLVLHPLTQYPCERSNAK